MFPRTDRLVPLRFKFRKAGYDVYEAYPRIPAKPSDGATGGKANPDIPLNASSYRPRSSGSLRGLRQRSHYTRRSTRIELAYQLASSSALNISAGYFRTTRSATVIVEKLRTLFNATIHRSPSRFRACSRCLCLWTSARTSSWSMRTDHPPARFRWPSPPGSGQAERGARRTWGPFEKLVLENKPLAFLIAERNRSRYDIDRCEKLTNSAGDALCGR